MSHGFKCLLLLLSTGGSSPPAVVNKEKKEHKVGLLTTYKYSKQAHYSATSTTVSYSVACRTRGLITSKRIQPSVTLTTVCPLLTSLWVGQPMLIQPYASCYPLTSSVAFQPTVTVPYWQATGCSVTSVLFYGRAKVGRRCWISGCPYRPGRLTQKTATAVTGGGVPIRKKVVVTAPTYHHWRATLRAASPGPLHTLGKSWHYLPTTSRQWDCSLTPTHRTRYRMRPGGLSLRGDGLSIGPRTKAHLAGVKGPGEDQRRPKIVTNCIVSVQPLEYRTRFPS